jgi:hypothetical protein
VTVQEKVVPGILLDKMMEEESPEQNVCDAGDAVATGVAFTIIVTIMLFPVHPFAVGVIVYTT